MDNFEFDFDDLMTSDAEYVEVANEADHWQDVEDFDNECWEYEQQRLFAAECQLDLGW